MNELATKSAKLIEDINTRQTAALTAAEAEGATEEVRAKHLAEFDKLQADKEKAQDTFKRADRLARDVRWSADPRTEPVKEKVATGPNIILDDEGPAFSAARVKIPARARRYSNLKTFKGPDGEKEAYAAGLWYAGALFGHRPSAQRANELGLTFSTSEPHAAGVQANLDGLSNQTGSYFVPDIVETKIIEITQQFGVIRRLAENVPMGSETLTTPRWSTAMIAYWIGRGSKPTQSDPAWNAIQLVVKEMGAYTKIAKQLNEDSLIDLGEKVTNNVAFAFAYAEDNAAFNGDGTSTYGGINGVLTRLGETANANSVKTATGHTTVPALTNADFLAVTGNAPVYPNADYRWIIHKAVWSQSMAALQLAGGGNRVDEVAGGGRMAYLGYPVEFCQVMPKAPTTGQLALIFADLSLSVKVGDRRGRTVQAGYENDDFTKQLITLLGTQRLDIVVHTVVDPKGDTTISGGPIMALKLG